MTPSQKTAVKRVIYPLYRLASGKKKIETQYKLTEFSKPRCHTFFGYYDVSPFQENKIIYLEKEKCSNVCRIVLNDIHNTSKQYLAESHAWNWQQGVRLRWFPQTQNVISFNDYNNDQYFNRILDIETQEEKRVDWPLYDIDCNGKYGITLDFERLGVMRPGYGYTCKPYKACDLWNDGISIIDIERNCLINKITYRSLSERIKKANDINHYYLNHLSFSHDGSKFLFFWIDQMNGFDQASLGVYDIKNEDLIPLETEGKASHYVWDGDDEIICTVLDKNYNGQYYRFNVKERTKKLICENSLQRDGHPSIYSKDVILTDTYPDKMGFQHIYVADETNDRKKEIVKIYSVPTVNVEMRTDLHPRLSNDRKLLSFDSNHDCFRKMLVLSFDK